MEMSPEIDKLATALAKAQTTLANASKDASNPFFKSKYATLASVWDAWQAVGPVNGLGVVQTVDGDGGEFSVATILTHSSGQWIKCVTPILLGKKDMQSLGSAITYARRYGLSAMVGISPEDDDGAAAAKSPQTNTAPAKQQKPTPEQNAQRDAQAIGKQISEFTSGDKLEAWWTNPETHTRVEEIGKYSDKAPGSLLKAYGDQMVKLDAESDNGPA